MSSGVNNKTYEFNNFLYKKTEKLGGKSEKHKYYLTNPNDNKIAAELGYKIKDVGQKTVYEKLKAGNDALAKRAINGNICKIDIFNEDVNLNSFIVPTAKLFFNLQAPIVKSSAPNIFC